MKKRVNWTILVGCFLTVILVSLIGSIFTGQNSRGLWYESIKPSITPPGYVFGIVWTILFFLIALALYFVYNKAENKKKVAWIFGINFALNILWSILYFGLHAPFLAFIEILFLWFSIFALINFSRKIDRAAAWLLLPYLFWVSFAAVLNYLSIR